MIGENMKDIRSSIIREILIASCKHTPIIKRARSKKGLKNLERIIPQLNKGGPAFFFMDFSLGEGGDVIEGSEYDPKNIYHYRFKVTQADMHYFKEDILLFSDKDNPGITRISGYCNPLVGGKYLPEKCKKWIGKIFVAEINDQSRRVKLRKSKSRKGDKIINQLFKAKFICKMEDNFPGEFYTSIESYVNNESYRQRKNTTFGFRTSSEYKELFSTMESDYLSAVKISANDVENKKVWSYNDYMKILENCGGGGASVPEPDSLTTETKPEAKSEGEQPKAELKENQPKAAPKSKVNDSESKKALEYVIPTSGIFLYVKVENDKITDSKFSKVLQDLNNFKSWNWKDKLKLQNVKSDLETSKLNLIDICKDGDLNNGVIPIGKTISESWIKQNQQDIKSKVKTHNSSLLNKPYNGKKIPFFNALHSKQFFADIGTDSDIYNLLSPKFRDCYAIVTAPATTSEKKLQIQVYFGNYRKENLKGRYSFERSGYSFDGEGINVFNPDFWNSEDYLFRDKAASLISGLCSSVTE